MKKFTIPCDFGGQKAPFNIYVGEPEPSKHPLQHQAHWLSVERGGPADKAGLRPTRRTRSGRISLGDVIVAIDDKSIEKANDLFDVLEKYKIGDTVTLTILRDDKQTQVQATLGSAD